MMAVVLIRRNFGSRMGNLCCSNNSVTADKATPKSAPRTNGQLTSNSTTVTVTKTQPWPASTNNGTTSVNRSTNNQQSTTVTKGIKNNSSAVFQVRTVKVTATATSSSNGSARSGEDERDLHVHTNNTDINEQEIDDKYSFPPVLEDFNLMDCDVDPTELEDLFVDEKLRDIRFDLQTDGPPMGFTIVGGAGSEHGDLPIVVKRISPDGLAHQEGQLRVGDEVIAVNDTLLVGQTQDYVTQTFKSLPPGLVRLLVLQDPE
ncbi:inaD-like protein isoform X2 [Dysidea avara]|uniref:inaD-like protein isoform X2 n=1 Tax=Dysidea avara TaxID=196820 RepID=UPI0033175493